MSKKQKNNLFNLKDNTNKLPINKVKDIIRDIEKVAFYIYNHYNICTYFEHHMNTGYDPKYKVIIINKRQTLPSQLSAILHECGHVIMLNDNPRQYNNSFQYSCYTKRTNNKRPSNMFILDSTREEVIAWEHGIRVKRLLQLQSITNQEYHNHYRRSFMTYLRYAQVAIKTNWK